MLNNSQILRPLVREEAPQNGFYSRSAIVYPWSSPIPLVFVEGDANEMGRQFGKATKGVLVRNVAFNLPIVERILDRFKVNKEEYAKSLEDAITKYTTSEYLDELQSMADVSDVPYRDMLLLNANADIIASFPASMVEDRFSCSAFAAWGDASQGSATIGGHNDDGNRVMDQYAVLKVARPKNGYPFVCPQVPGYLGYDCLVNANQVLICGTSIDVKMKESEMVRDGVPNWALYRWLGQFSANAADAEDRLLANKSMTFKNWLFVSRDKGGRVVEATPKHHASMKYPREGDWLGLSTCVVASGMSKYAMPQDNATSGIYRKASIDMEVSSRHGKITTESAIEILSSHYDSFRRRRVPSEHTPCRHMEYEGKHAGTCRSLICTFSGGSSGEEKSTRIDVCLGNPCNGYWRELYFDSRFNLKSGYEREGKVETELGQLLVEI
jgi:hypothetical protein